MAAALANEAQPTMNLQDIRFVPALPIVKARQALLNYVEFPEGI
jgi:hypothetical protein